jgi:hypothetical protein
MSEVADAERAGQTLDKLLSTLFPFEVRGRKKQNIEVAILNPDSPSALSLHRITPFEARMLRDRLVKQAGKLNDLLELLDRENGLIT